MLVLFLDLDGVCNSTRFMVERAKAGTWDSADPKDWTNMLDPVAVALLNKVVEATGCKIVISSSWRHAHSIDTQSHGRPVKGTPFFNIVENPETGRCVVTMQGGHRSGRRYASYASVTEAQKAGIRWAGRRFRVPVEVASC